MNRKKDAGTCSQVVERIWVEQSQGWENGNMLRAEDFFQKYPQLDGEPEFMIDVIFNEFAILTSDRKSWPDTQSFYSRFPNLEHKLRKQFELFTAVNEVTIPDSKFDVATDIVGNAALQPNKANKDSDSPENRFDIKRELGRGATAVVYEAWDHQMEQLVALKKPYRSNEDSHRARARLISEARSVSRLHHPGIVPFREICQTMDGLILVSPFVPGKNLQSYVDDENPPGVAKSVEWAIQIADSLHYSHENGVIHRDVKPSNVLINENDGAMLIDFGLAINANVNLSITQTGEIIGTPAYMSPEQAIGNRDLVDCRSDVYSLGAVLYVLLCGQLPFNGSFSSVIHQLVTDPPKPIRMRDRLLPRELEVITNKCLNKNPGERYSSARDLSDDLRRFQKGQLIHARPAGPIERVVKFARRRPRLAAIGLALLASLLFSAGTIFQLSNVTEQRNRAKIAERENQRLLADASLDAGKLAMQRGRLVSASNHFETGLSLSDVPDQKMEFHRQLCECYLALGYLSLAKSYLQKGIATMPGSAAEKELSNSAITDYFKAELAANGAEDFGNFLEIVERTDITKLDGAKRHFLDGLNADDSNEALSKFREAIKLDPYHHSARRMSLIMALSLAKFEDVISDADVASQLYPEDVDFRLLKALACSALNRLGEAKQIVNRLGLDNEEEWQQLCEFVNFVSNNVKAEGGISRTELKTVSRLLTDYFERFQPLLEQRRWRFPPRIGSVFARFSKLVLDLNDFESARQVSNHLANIHPEGTLLLIAADCSVTHGETIEQLEDSRDFFRQATQGSAFIHDHRQEAWLGLYTMAMNLAVIQKHEVEANTRYFVSACEHLDPESISDSRYHAAIAKTLGNIEEWHLAQPFIDRWIELSASDSQQLAAYWHKAVAFKRENDWVGVLHTCDYVLANLQSELPPFKQPQPGQAWNSLRETATGKLTQLINGQLE